MNYLIVDDEPLAHEIIESMCVELPFMVKIGNCYRALDALEFLSKHPIHVMFLDVHMPRLGGFDFLRTLRMRPAVIAISADRDFALEAFDLDISDYLLKPFLFERFLKAVNKVREQLGDSARQSQQQLVTTVILKDGKKHHQVLLQEIVYIEACGNYCLVHLECNHILTQETMTELLAKLPDRFIRIHKSYIVNRDKIRLVAGGEVMVKQRNIPIGRAYKNQINQWLKSDEAK